MAAAKQVGDRVLITAGLHKDQIATLVGKEGRAWQVKLEDGETVNVPFPQVASIEVVASHENANTQEAAVSEGIAPSSEEATDEAENANAQEQVEGEGSEANSEASGEEATESSDSATETGGHVISPNGEITIGFQLAGTDVIGSADAPQATPPVVESPKTDSESKVSSEQPKTKAKAKAKAKAKESKADGPKDKSKRSAKRERSIEGIDASDLTKLSVVELQALAISRGVGIARTKNDFLRIIAELRPNENLERLRGKDLFDRVGQLHISRLRNKADLIELLKD